MHHKPVLLNEIIELLDPKPGAIVLDGTIGSGGHAKAFLERIGPEGRLIGLDQDPEAICRCRKLLGDDPRVTLVQRNLRDLELVLNDLNMTKVDRILFDIGLSSDQLADCKRGFSFQTEGDLDMRMNPAVGSKASEYLMTLSEKELARVFYEYADEHRSRRFASAIVRERKKSPIVTTSRLCQIIENSLPASHRFEKGKRPVGNRRNQSTKVFQALRILVNDEFGALHDGMIAAWNRLRPGGRLGVISFHSGEDRIVKEKFRDYVKNSGGELVTRKPVIAKRSEIVDNPRARSAKLRVIGVRP